MPAPGVYPVDGPRPTASEGEKRVYAALARGLPNGWYAWHSVPVVVNGHDAEADFIVADPAGGWIAIEVKGGRVEQRGGRWHQNGAPMDKDPGQQARNAAHSVAHALERRVSGPTPRFSHALWLPDVDFETGPTQGDLDHRVLGRQDLDWAREALLALRGRLPADPGRAGTRWIDGLHALWGERWVPSVRLGMRARRAESARVALDARQRATLDLFERNPRVLVEGAAGTGKSLLAVEAAHRRAARGERVLLTCFTRGLARCLEAACHGSDGIDVASVRQLALDLLRASGAALDESEPGFWDEVSFRAAVDALGASGRRWDAVIVDEGQDLSASDWMLVEQCAAGGALWGFHDPAQRFWPDRAVPERLFATRIALPTAYRTPDALGRLARSFAAGAPDARFAREAIAGGELAIIAAPSESAVLGRIERELEKLLGEGLEPSDIAIVSLRGQSPPESVARLDRIGRHRLARADAPDADDHVIADTFLRLKGLERPVVLVADLRLVQDHLGVRMYVALTRALVAARIVAPAEVLRRYDVFSDELATSPA